MLEAELTNDIGMQIITKNSAKFFLFWVIEVKCRPRAYGEEFLKKERGCFLQDTNIQKPLSVFQYLSRFEIFSLIFAAYFSGFLIFNIFLF